VPRLKLALKGLGGGNALPKGTKKADLVAALSTLVAAKVAQPAAPDASGPADAVEESEFEDWSSGRDDSERGEAWRPHGYGRN